MQQYADIYC